jgi:hypothetical protein
MVRSAFAKASADLIKKSTRRSFSVGGQAHHEGLILYKDLILSLSKDEARVSTLRAKRNRITRGG